LREFLHKCHTHVPEQDLVAIIRRIDIDGDQLLSRKDWDAFLAPEFDWDKLVELTKLKENEEAKFDYAFWKQDLRKVTEAEGFSLLQAYIENAGEACSPEAIKMIVDAGVPVNNRDKADQNALWNAANHSDDIEVYRALYSRGVEVDYIPKDGNDIFHDYLLECGKNQKDSHEADDAVLISFLDRGLSPAHIKNADSKARAEKLISDRRAKEEEEAKKRHEEMAKLHPYPHYYHGYPAYHHGYPSYPRYSYPVTHVRYSHPVHYAPRYWY
jgi:hypothetical protein